MMDRQIQFPTDQNQFPIDQKILDSNSLDRFSDKHRIDLYQSLNTTYPAGSDEQKLIVNTILPVVRFGDSARLVEAATRLENSDPMSRRLSDRSDKAAGAQSVPTTDPNRGTSEPYWPRYRRDSNDYNHIDDGIKMDAKPIDCTDEYEVLRGNRTHVAEQLADADRALSDGDLNKFRKIFSDPLISKADRDKFLKDGGQERIADEFGSWIFGETQTQRDALAAVRNGQSRQDHIKNATDEKLLACEARMLSEEFRTEEQQIEDQRQRNNQQEEESRVKELIEEIPDIVRESAMRGESSVAVLLVGFAGRYSDAPQPQLDHLQQKVFDRLTDLGLKPSIKQIYVGGDTMWVMTASW